MKRILAAMAILAAAAVAQPQQGPWSEQPPQPEQPGYGPPPGGPNQPPAPQPDSDPGSAEHGVARISFMNGSVSVRRGDSADLVAAVVNAPLTIGDRVVTGDGGRAEVQLDSANFFRLAPGTEVRLSELQRGLYQIQVAAGTIVYRVLRDSNAQIEISTPSISVHPEHAGVYRINVNPDGITEITLRKGADGEVFGPRGSEPIHNNGTMMVRGSSNDPEFQVVAPTPEDDFERWSASRDQTLERATSPGRVNRDITGTEDLDPYGHWVNDGAYGQVWVPTVGPGWAPYACGRWVWVDYYGWTWVGCEPWAWAPYHYGRWYNGSFGWAWWPGPIYGGVFWRPALVGFFGWGAPGFGVGFGFGFGFANVGWVPLAPYEGFHPWWGPGGYRAAVVNVNVTNVYRNARVANGVTSIRAGDFGRAGVAPSTMVRANGSDLARAGAVNGRLPMSVVNESRQFSNARASSAGIPRTAENTRFFSSAASRTRGAMSTGGARGAESGPGGAPARPNSAGWQRVTPATGGANSGAWQRFPAGGNNGSARPGAQPQVRINPSIVQNPGSQSRGSSYSGGGGGASRAPGGYARPAPQSAPRNSGGGAPRNSGGSRGGGGHGGHR